MSWLSHFTGWVGEKKSTILPIVTGLAGFAAGMIPGIGGALEKKLDKWGSKVSNAADSLDQIGRASDVTSPNSPAVVAVKDASFPTTATDVELGTAQNRRNTPAAGGKSNTPLLIGGGILAYLLLSGNRR